MKIRAHPLLVFELIILVAEIVMQCPASTFLGRDNSKELGRFFPHPVVFQRQIWYNPYQEQTVH